jgi:hypothetical protein
MPLAMADFKPQDYINPKESIMPIVNQCRYSGIFVPENCIVGNVFGYKEKYSQNNIDVRKSDLIDKSIKLIENLIKEIKKRKNK